MQEPCTLEVGAWNAARRDRPRGRTAGLWDSPFPAIPPFLSVLSVCMCLCVCVCVGIYNNIYMFVCLLEDCGSGKGAGARTRFPFCI